LKNQFLGFNLVFLGLIHHTLNRSYELVPAIVTFSLSRYTRRERLGGSVRARGLVVALTMNLTKKKKSVRRQEGFTTSEAGRASRPSLQSGFTLIEILVVMGLIAVLAGVVLVAINPTRQFAQGRDAQRTSNINAILNAIGQRIADNKGLFAGINPANGVTCPSIPATTTMIMFSNATSTPSESGDLGCLVPTYLETLPTDPSGVTVESSTGYMYFQDVNGRVHVMATTTEPSIPRTTPLEVVR